jgi:Tol biopolymer transport system component
MFSGMKRALACLLLLGVTGCGTGHSRAVGSPSPKSKVLVYAKATPPNLPNTTENVWQASIDGRNPKLIARDSTDPTVSPDGRTVAYENGGNVLVASTTGGKPTILYRHGGYPTWAPDSRHVAVFANDAFVVIDAQTGASTTIATPAGTDSISFSPDSRRIAYSTGSPRGGDLYVASIASGRSVRITRNRSSYDPVWGPTGIAFLRDAPGPGPHGDVWLTGPRPNDAHQLTHTRADIWPESFSANGKQLLAAYPANHNARLWAVDVPSGRARPITPWVGDLYGQGLSADGKTVLAAVGCGGMPEPYGYIETIPFAGGKPHIVTRGPCRASWSAGA